jgi:ABC-2 type transport system permease protein
VSAADVTRARAPQLEPVPGPSALGGGRRRFLDLLWVMSSIDFRLSFHGTALGYLWSLARPMLIFGVLLAVFTQVFRFGDEVKDYPALLLLNIMLFTLFAEGTGKAVVSAITREGIVRKTQFPRLVIPLSVVLTEMYNLGLNLLAVFIFILAYGVDPIWTWVMLPVLILALFVLTLAVAMLLCALYPRFRDLGLIWGVLTTVLFYSTPILYPISYAIAQTDTVFHQIIQLNPLTPIFEQAQEWIIDHNAPGAVEATSTPILAASIAGYVAICVLAVIVFRREAPRIAEEL